MQINEVINEQQLLYLCLDILTNGNSDDKAKEIAIVPILHHIIKTNIKPITEGEIIRKLIEMKVDHILMVLETKGLVEMELGDSPDQDIVKLTPLGEGVATQIKKVFDDE